MEFGAADGSVSLLPPNLLPAFVMSASCSETCWSPFSITMFSKVCQKEMLDPIRLRNAV